MYSVKELFGAFYNFVEWQKMFPKGVSIMLKMDEYRAKELPDVDRVR